MPRKAKAVKRVFTDGEMLVAYLNGRANAYAQAASLAATFRDLQLLAQALRKRAREASRDAREASRDARAVRVGGGK